MNFHNHEKLLKISQLSILSPNGNFDPIPIDIQTFENANWTLNLSLLPDIRDLPSNSRFTIVMVDPDAPSPTAASARYWLHWEVVNIDIPTLTQGKGGHRVQLEYLALNDFLNSELHIISGI